MSRLREDSQTSTHIVHCNRYSPSPQQMGDCVGMAIGEYRSMTDEVIPNFKRRMAEGEVFFSPMLSVKQSQWVNASGGFLDWKCTGASCGPANNFVGYRMTDTIADKLWMLSMAPPGTGMGTLLTPNLSFTSGEMENAISEAATRVNAERGMSQNNLWESIAEFDKSVKMLPEALHSLRSFIMKTARTKQGRRIKSLYTTVRRTNKYDLPKIGTIQKFVFDPKIGAGANLYLLYRYGIRPFLQDIYGIIDGGLGRLGKVRSTSRAQVSLSKADVTGYSGQNPWTGVTNYSATQTSKLSATARAMSLDEADTSFYFNIGFSAKGFFGTPWELVPLSFVVDWVANIGDLMYAIMPTPFINQLGSCVTLTSTYEFEYKLKAHTDIPGMINQFTVQNPDLGSFTVKREEKKRTIGLPTPKLLIRSDFQLDNIVRSMDAAALLLQTMKHPFK